MEKEKLVKALENYFEDCKFRKRLNNNHMGDHGSET